MRPPHISRMYRRGSGVSVAYRKRAVMERGGEIPTSQWQDGSLLRGVHGLLLQGLRSWETLLVPVSEIGKRSLVLMQVHDYHLSHVALDFSEWCSLPHKA